MINSKHTFLKNGFVELQFTHLKYIINDFSLFFGKRKYDIKCTTLTVFKFTVQYS